MKLSPQAIGNARAVLIAGPTAGGKSAAALDLAEAAERSGRSAWIVNADSMQVYDALRILTARPGRAEERLAPHRLYGHVPAETRYSVGAWLSDAAAVLAEAEAAGALPIVVGGTGLYFKALSEGLAAVPAIPAEVRARWSERLKAGGPAPLHALLVERDPIAAAAIRPSDPQRILRALEVLDATGIPLSDWHGSKGLPPLVPASRTLRIVMAPDRQTLHNRIAERLDRMIADGAVDEVKALLARGLSPDLPAMKAIGVKELAAFLGGEVTLEAALAQAAAETRRYAKRQMTWFRGQMPDWTWSAG
jgi:tRNA dimethylallyltransferase